MDDHLPSVNVLTIDDGNALFYYFKDVPDNFNQICEKLYNMTGNYKNVIVSNEIYKTTYVKALESKRKGISEKIIIKGSNTKKTLYWKRFLAEICVFT